MKLILCLLSSLYRKTWKKPVVPTIALTAYGMFRSWGAIVTVFGNTRPGPRILFPGMAAI